MTQNQEILKHLLSGRSITPLEALADYGVFRLAARCYDLRSQGHDIKTVIIDNKGKKFAKYYLNK